MEIRSPKSVRNRSASEVRARPRAPRLFVSQHGEPALTRLTYKRSPQKDLLQPGSRSAMAVPKSKNLYSLSVGAHTVVEVVVNATKVDASDAGEPGLGDKWAQ